MTNKFFLIAVFGTAITVSAAHALAQQGAVIRDATLVVEANTMVQVPRGRTGILVDRFVMEEGSTLSVSDETPLLVIRAKSATAGNRTRIVAQGRDGVGTQGAGANGPTVILILEDVDEVRGLTVASTGGDGTDGEPGAKGSNGRAAECAGDGAGNGGPGGQGANGGSAGNGGKIFLIIPRDALGYGITMNVGPGEPGLGGEGGPGGAGGKGKKRCGVWPYWKRGPGDSGPRGRRGSDGSEGEWGVFYTYAVENFEQETLGDRLQGIMEILREGGYSGDAEALRAVLDAGGLTAP